jgi:hypothetical protein
MSPENNENLTEAVLEFAEGIGIIKAYNLMGEKSQKSFSTTSGKPAHQPATGKIPHIAHDLDQFSVRTQNHRPYHPLPQFRKRISVLVEETRCPQAAANPPSRTLSRAFST